MKYVLVTHATIRQGQRLLTVKSIPSWFLRLLGKKEKTQTYVGGGTVWREYPSFIRTNTFIESILSDFDAKIDYENDK